jgi:hypothetical protein
MASNLQVLTFPLILSSQGNCLVLRCTVHHGPKPPQQNESFELFWKLWMRFLTVSLLWYVRYEILAKPDYPVSVRLRL